RASTGGAHPIGIGLRCVSRKSSRARITEVDGARRLSPGVLRQRQPLPVAAPIRGVEKGNASLADDDAVVALEEHLLGAGPIPLKLLLPVSAAIRGFEDDRWAGRRRPRRVDPAHLPGAELDAVDEDNGSWNRGRPGCG